MNNKDKLLTESEVKYITIGTLIGIGFFKLSEDVVKEIGQDGWITNIVGCVYPIFIILISSYIIKMHPTKNIIDIGKEYFGNFLGSVFGMIYLLEFITLVASITNGFSNVLRIYAVTFLPEITIIICIILCASYAGILGLKDLSRMSKFIFYIFMIPIFISIGALRTGDPYNLLPFMQCGVKRLLKASTLTVFQYSGLEFLTLIHPNIYNKNTVAKNALKGLGIIVTIYTWIVFVTIYYLGPDIVPKSLWPFTLVMESINVPVINNFRFVFIFLWAIVMIKTISNYYYYSIICIHSVFKTDKKRILMILSPICIILSALFTNEMMRRYLGNAIVYTEVAFNVSYIIIIALITYMKTHRGKPNVQQQDNKLENNKGK